MIHNNKANLGTSIMQGKADVFLLPMNEWRSTISDVEISLGSSFYSRKVFLANGKDVEHILDCFGMMMI